MTPQPTDPLASPDSPNRLDLNLAVPALAIPVIEEVATVNRKVVETGRIRLQKSVQQEEQTLNISLQHEEVQVERVPVNQFVPDGAPAPAARYEGTTMIVPVVREVLVKRLLVVEEIHVRKHVVTTEETAVVQLRQEQVNVVRHPASDTPAV